MSTPVEITIHINAEPATVWRFLSEPERFAAWIGCFGGRAPLPGTRVDCSVGGEVRVEYPGGSASSGKIVAIDPMRRIEFTWGYPASAGAAPVEPGSTRVEITLARTDTGTRVTLRHSGLPEERRADHAQGWRHYLSMLARQAADEQFGHAASEAVEAYFAAWNQPDASLRGEMLGRCCEPDVRMRSAFAAVDSLAELDDHITNALRHMPGASLRPAGGVQQLHGFARVAWGVWFGGPTPAMRGENFIRLSPAGRLSEIVSFGDEPPAPA
jgi:uncharacterized protein YndB with AHSA1/START domain